MPKAEATTGSKTKRASAARSKPRAAEATGKGVLAKPVARKAKSPEQALPASSHTRATVTVNVSVSVAVSVAVQYMEQISEDRMSAFYAALRPLDSSIKSRLFKEKVEEIEED